MFKHVFSCGRFKLSMPSAPLEKEKLPMLRALDTHPSKPTEFIAGTEGCDIWEVRPRTCQTCVHYTCW